MFVLALFLATGLATFSEAAQTQTIHAHGERADGHGRIVFDLAGGDLPYNVRLEGSRLTVVFQRPVAGKFGAVARTLPGYVRAARLSKDGRTIVFDLKGRYRLQTTTRSDSVAIRLYPVAGGAATAKPTSRPAARGATAVAPKSRLAPKRRPGSAKSPVKLAGKKPTAKSAAAKKTGAKKPAAKKPAAKKTAAKSAAKKPTAKSAAKKTAAKSAAKKPTAEKTPETKTAAAVEPAPAPDKVTVAASETAVPAGPGTNSPPAPVRPDAETATASTEPVVAKPAAVPAPAADPAPAGAKTLAARDKIAVRFLPGGSADDFSLRFEWPMPVAAAVYRRGGFVWMVFDRAETLDLTAAQRAGGAATASLGQVPVPLAAAARIKVGRGVNPAVRRDGYAWIIELRRQQGVPAEEIRVQAQPKALTGPRVLLPVQGAVEPRVVTDEVLSETLLVVPVRPVGFGVGSDRVFPEFRLLATAQGIVVRSQGKGLNVRRVRDGVQITRTGGLVVSGGGPAAREVHWPGTKPSLRNRILDIKAWRGRKGSFLYTKHKLQAAIAASSESERGRHRLALSQFFFANGFMQEALGTMKMIRAEDSIGAEPAFRLLFGAAAVLAGMFDLAENELLDPALVNEPEAALWRGALFAGKLDWETAERYFVAGAGMLRFYDEPYRSDFALGGARASIERNAPDMAARFLDLFDNGKPTREQRWMSEYLKAETLRVRGKTDDALKQYSRLIKRAVGPVRVRAALARTSLLVAEDKMLRSDAVEELEILRFVWRGDEVEFAVLNKLAGYYFTDGDYLRGLANLRRAVSYYPDHPKADHIRGRMRKVFFALFLEGGDEALTPLKALAIYEDFKDLTPKSESGDAIIAHLAERLVEVDLLEDADALLTAQIENRLKGESRAAAGARLAAIRLSDRRPKEAIVALDTSTAKGLPEYLVMERNRMRARANGDLGETDAGLQAIAADPGAETELVRATLYWRAHNWAGASVSLGRLAETIPVVDSKLSEDDAKLILAWATALALSGDKNGLLVLRRRFDHLMEKNSLREPYRVVANETDTPVTDYPTLVARVRQATVYEGFMAAYHKRLKGGGQPATQVQ